MNKYIYTGPTMLLGESDEFKLRNGMEVLAEVNVNIAKVNIPVRMPFCLEPKEYEAEVAAKYLEPVKPETIDFTKDDADKESAQHIVDMITDDKDFEHLIGFQNFCESIMGMRFGNQHNDNHEVGGNHYKMAIEPWDYIFANKLDFDSGNVVKYISRHKKKNGAEDVKKAISFCKHILKTQYGEE